MTSRQAIREAAKKHGWRLAATGYRSQLDIFRRNGIHITVEYTDGEKVLYADFSPSGSTDWDRIMGGRPAIIDTLRMFGAK